jgi:hypothetical protein
MELQPIALGFSHERGFTPINKILELSLYQLGTEWHKLFIPSILGPFQYISRYSLVCSDPTHVPVVPSTDI